MDFEPQSPEFQETFAGLETGLDLTICSFSFFVNNLGTQDLTEPRQLATAAADTPSTVAPTMADPSIASASLSISSPTTMSTREFNECLDGLADEEVKSTFHTNKTGLDRPLEDTFDYGISLSDFTEPEIQIDNNVDMQIGDSNNLNSEVHHNFNDIEMSKNDDLVASKHFPE